MRAPKTPFLLPFPISLCSHHASRLHPLPQHQLRSCGPGRPGLASLPPSQGGGEGLARPSRTATRQWGSGCCPSSGDLNLLGVPRAQAGVPTCSGQAGAAQRAGRAPGARPGAGKGGWGQKNGAFQALLSCTRPVPAAPRPPHPQPPAPTGREARHPALPELGLPNLSCAGRG